MRKQKKIMKKVKQIVIVVGNSCEIFELTPKEKLKCSDKDLNEKCKNILIKIDEYKHNQGSDAAVSKLDENTQEIKISDILNNFSNSHFDDDLFNDLDQI